MLRLLSIGIDVAASSTVLLPAIAILRHTFYPENNRKKGVWAAVFALYLTAVFSATGLPSVNERTVDAAVNWIPLAAALGDPAGYAKNMIWNLIMFIPLGVLLPGLWTEFRCLRDVSFFGLGLSAAIELAQYCRPMNPLFSPARSRTRKGGSPRLSFSSRTRATRRSEATPTSTIAVFSWSRASATA